MNLVVEGMTCGHCVRTVTQAIQALDPHAQEVVDLGSGVVKVEGLLAVEQAVEA
uniref:heavy-metal-associated domain-containing protein n=1 Tax=Streptomyces zhihengii TaxID=1818004 RepID=UPI0036D77A04